MATDGSYSLDEIADRLAIGQVIARYVHALDARDYAHDRIVIGSKFAHE